MNNEIWKPVLGYENFYQVSNFGRVKSLEREVRNTNKSKRLVKSRILKPYTEIGRYKTVMLSVSDVKKTAPIHRLVVEAFIKPIKKGLVVNHLDGNKHNNNLSNLEITTYSENNKHAHRLGLNYAPNLKGEDSGRSYFTNDQVLEIRQMRLNGSTFSQIADCFGCSISTIANIVYRRTWKHI
jgi:hypothetical protein